MPARRKPPAAFAPEPLRHCHCGCGAVAFHGVGDPLTLKNVTWWGADCFWRSRHGVEMALGMAASANVGIDDED